MSSTNYETHCELPPPLSCYLVPLRPQYFPQHPVLEHPQPTFLHQSTETMYVKSDTVRDCCILHFT